MAAMPETAANRNRPVFMWSSSESLEAKFAEANLDKLATVDQKKEHTLLFRGLMVYHAKSGDLALAEEYMNRAIELSPEQKDLILKEYEEAARQ